MGLYSLPRFWVLRVAWSCSTVTLSTLRQKDITLGCGWCYRTLSSWGGDVCPTAEGQKEKLWWAFFSDPLQWWDHRLEKESVRYPDFKHKKTQEALWLDDRWKPPWVEAEMAAIVPGTLQLNNFSCN